MHERYIKLNGSFYYNKMNFIQFISIKSYTCLITMNEYILRFLTFNLTGTFVNYTLNTNSLIIITNNRLLSDTLRHFEKPSPAKTL